MALLESGTVIVHGQKLNAAAQTYVQQACARADAHCVVWPARGTPPIPPSGPTLLIAGLSAGDRQIPRETLELMTAFSGAPLLLLSQEPLVRPSISLDSGRIQLVSPPHVEGSLYPRIRALLSDQRPAPRFRVHDTSPMGFSALGNRVVLHESERARFWVGGIACVGNKSTKDLPPLPYLFEQSAAGITAIIPTSPEAAPHLNGAKVDQVAQNIRIEEPLEMKLAALKELLPSGHGIVHFSSRVSEWLFYWPEGGAELTLLSPLRLPNVFHFGAQLIQAGSLLKIPAAAGDVVVGMSRPPSSHACREVIGGASALGSVAMSGRSLLKLFDEALRATPVPFSLACVQVM